VKTMRLRFRLMDATIAITPRLVMGLVLVGLGISLLILGLSAQLDIDSIGATTDPALQERVSQLETERDIFILTAAGTIFIGLFMSFILAEKKIASVVPESQMTAAAKGARDILSGLSLAGNAVYLPAKHGLTREKIFVPATNGSMSPPTVLSDDLTLSPGKDGSTPGLLIEPTGMRLLNDLESQLELKVANTDTEFVEGGLQILKHGLSVMRDFHFKERDGKTILRVEYSGFSEPCRLIRKEWPDTCRQMSCVGCSCLLTALARATGKIVKIDEVDNKEDTVVFTLSLLEW
ncbi:MAG: hypothetical protein WBD03_04515, partial [Thermoplasmata archaeon]